MQSSRSKSEIVAGILDSIETQDLRHFHGLLRALDRTGQSHVIELLDLDPAITAYDTVGGDLLLLNCLY